MKYYYLKIKQSDIFAYDATTKHLIISWGSNTIEHSKRQIIIWLNKNNYHPLPDKLKILI
jgi:hypothetical protein